MSLRQIQREDPVAARPKTRMSRREEAEMRYERLWQQNPEQFLLMRSARSRFCAEAAWNLIKNLPFYTACDLGSGCGYFSQLLHNKGATVDAVDIAKTALARNTFLPSERKVQAYIPYTPLPDNHYDLVIAYDLIASIPDNEQRLFFSELTRLAKDDGTILVSTSLDIHSENPLGRLLHLAQSELTIETIQLSYHKPQILLENALSLIPSLKNSVGQSDRLLKFLHKLSSNWQDPEQASHAILLGKKKPLKPHL